MKNTTFESIGGTYKMTNDCLIPELSIAEIAPLGKWGLLRKHYLMDNHKALYSSWMLTGELDKHLAQVEQEAQKRFDQIVVQLWFWRSSFIRWKGKKRNQGKSSRGLTRSTICRLFLMQIS